MAALRDVFTRFIGFLPSLVAGLLVLAIGWGVAVFLSYTLRRALPRLGFDRFLSRHKLMSRPPESRAGSRAAAGAAATVVFIAALMQAANIWGLGFIAAGLARVIAYLPNLISAALIFGAAVIVGNWSADRLRSGTAEERERSSILPGAVRAGIMTIGAFVALRQLLIATEILVIGFTLAFGAIALATALAFGMGGRRAAERMTDEWYDRQRAHRRTPASAGYARQAGEPSSGFGHVEPVEPEERGAH